MPILNNYAGYMYDIAYITNRSGFALEAYGKIASQTQFTIEKLGKAFKLLRMEAVEPFEPALAKLVEGLLWLVEAFRGLDEGIKSAMVGAVLGIGIFALLAGAIALLAPAITLIIGLVGSVGSAGSLIAGFSLLAMTIGSLIGLGAAYADSNVAVGKSITSLAGHIQSARDIFTQYATDMMAVSDFKISFKALTVEINALKSVGKDASKAQKKLGDAIRAAGKLVPSAVTEWDRFGEALSISIEKMDEWGEEYKKTVLKKMKIDLVLAKNDLAMAKATVETLEKENGDIAEQMDILIKNWEEARDAAGLPINFRFADTSEALGSIAELRGAIYDFIEETKGGLYAEAVFKFIAPDLDDTEVFTAKIARLRDQAYEAQRALDQLTGTGKKYKEAVDKLQVAEKQIAETEKLLNLVRSAGIDRTKLLAEAQKLLNDTLMEQGGIWEELMATADGFDDTIANMHERMTKAWKKYQKAVVKGDTDTALAQKKIWKGAQKDWEAAIGVRADRFEEILEDELEAEDARFNISADMYVRYYQDLLDNWSWTTSQMTVLNEKLEQAERASLEKRYKEYKDFGDDVEDIFRGFTEDIFNGMNTHDAWDGVWNAFLVATQEAAAKAILEFTGIGDAISGAFGSLGGTLSDIFEIGLDELNTVIESITGLDIGEAISSAVDSLAGLDSAFAVTALSGGELTSTIETVKGEIEDLALASKGAAEEARQIFLAQGPEAAHAWMERWKAMAEATAISSAGIIESIGNLVAKGVDLDTAFQTVFQTFATRVLDMSGKVEEGSTAIVGSLDTILAAVVEKYPNVSVEMLASIRTLMETAAEGIKNSAESTMGEVGEVIGESVVTGIKNEVADVSAGDFATGDIDVSGNANVTLNQNVVAITGDMSEQLQSALNNIDVSALVTKLQEPASELITSMLMASFSVVESLSAIGLAVTEQVGTAITAVTTGPMATLILSFGTVNAQITTILNNLGEVADAVSHLVTSVGDDLVTAFGDVITKIGEAISAVEKLIKEIQDATSATEDLTEEFSNAADVVETDLSSAISSVAAEVSSLGASVLSNLVEPLEEAAGFASELASALQKVDSMLGEMGGLAEGGQIPGYGGGDIFPARLEPGEYVIRKEAVSKYGSNLFSKLNRQLIDRNSVAKPTGYAEGGSVGGLDWTSWETSLNHIKNNPVSDTINKAYEKYAELWNKADSNYQTCVDDGGSPGACNNPGPKQEKPGLPPDIDLPSGSGGAFVEQDGIWNLHADEVVLPTSKLRSMIESLISFPNNFDAADHIPMSTVSGPAARITGVSAIPQSEGNIEINNVFQIEGGIIDDPIYWQNLVRQKVIPEIDSELERYGKRLGG